MCLWLQFQMKYSQMQLWKLELPAKDNQNVLDVGRLHSCVKLTVSLKLCSRHTFIFSFFTRTSVITGIIPSQAGWNKGDSQKHMTNFGTPRNTQLRVKSENLQVICFPNRYVLRKAAVLDNFKIFQHIYISFNLLSH